jgi:hypothetical protein
VKDSSQDIKMIGVFGLLGFATLALALVPAYAQDAPALPFNLPPEGTTVAGPPKGVSVVAAPPAGFNPLTASPAAKAKFAIPPAPDVKAAPEAYNKWQQAVSAIAWIVERPTVFGGLATLTNYIDSAWPNGIALNYQAATPTYQYQGQTPAAGTLNAITMVDNNGNSISSATIENSDFLWFRDFGSAAYSP